MVTITFRAQALLVHCLRMNYGSVASAHVVRLARENGISEVMMRNVAKPLTRSTRRGVEVTWHANEDAIERWKTDFAHTVQLGYAACGEIPQRTFVDIFDGGEVYKEPETPQRPPWHDDNVVPLRDGDKKEVLE